MTIGAQIKHYREKMHWKLRDLSERTGVDVGTISALEVRDSMRSNHLVPIAAAFGLSVEQLADASTDHPVFDAKPPAYTTISQTRAATAQEPRPGEISDAWRARAIDALRSIHPDYRSETLSYLEWQVGRVAGPKNGNDISMAA